MAVTPLQVSNELSYRSWFVGCFAEGFEHSKEDGQDEQSENHAAHHTANNDGGQRSLNFGARAFAGSHWNEADAGNECRHQDGSQAVD